MRRRAAQALAGRSLQAARPGASAACAPPAVAELRLVGDPILAQKSRPVGVDNAEEAEVARGRLHSTLAKFREEHGFGRAIAAPQVGFSLRMVAMDLGRGAFTLYNPVLFDHSAATTTLWDGALAGHRRRVA